jgi:thiol-disulfide isomerase/thioredoxin/sugar lactone lactonase YvrE
MMRLAVLVLMIPPLFAQGLPDGPAVMKQIEEAAGKRQSLEYTIAISGEATRNGQRIPSPPLPATATVAVANPGKLRFEADAKTYVTDGALSWAYDSRTKQYTKTAAGHRISVLGIPQPDWISVPFTLDPEGSPRVAREETIEADGQKFECWVLVDNLRVPERDSARVSNTVLTSWIEKSSLIARKNEIALTLAGASPVELKITLAVRSLKVDDPAAAGRFTFVPPPDAREVASDAGRINLNGTDAPAFNAKDLQGNAYSRDSLKNKPVLLDFWASWCRPCAESTPALERIQAEFKDKGLVILAVNVGEDRKIVDAFLKPRPMHYPVIMGSEFGLDRAFQVSVFPTFILIAPGGKVVAHELGYGGEASLRAMIGKAGFGAPAPESATAAAGGDASRPVTPPALRYSPGAVAATGDGSLYIADTSAARIIRVPPGGAPVVVAGTGTPGFGGDGGPAIFASLNQPSALAVDGAGNIYIGDSGNARIRKVAADGTIATVAELRAGGLAVDASGNVYVSDTAGHRIRKITPDGKTITVAGTGTPGSTGDGGPAASAQLAGPAGLALDTDGNLYIADKGNHRVRKMVADGTILLVAGNGSAGFSGDRSLAVFAQLKEPTSVAVDAAGSVYIADGAARIRKVTAEGTITTHAQTGPVAGIAADRSGNVHFADSENGRVRVISQDGAVNTVPGTAPAGKQSENKK